MRDELEKRLVADFPWLTPHFEENEKIPFYMFGCECGDGWYSLIHDLCGDIEAAFSKRGLDTSINVFQIKEKFGTLRFYYELDDNDELSDLHDELHSLTDAAEEKSAHTCENCGKPGVLRNDGWYIETLCDECFEKARK